MLFRLYEFAITTYGPEVGSSKQNYYANRLLVLSLNKKRYLQLTYILHCVRKNCKKKCSLYYARHTSSSALAERPRDASCLSVVTFSSTIPVRRERNLLLLVTSALDLPLHTNKFCSVLSCSPWSSILVVINKIHWCVTVCAVDFTIHRRCCSHSTSHRSDGQIFVKNSDFCLPNLHSTPPISPFSRHWPWHWTWPKCSVAIEEHFGLYLKQEAQLSQRNCSMLRVIEYFPK